MSPKQNTLCDAIRRLGYAQHNQFRLYGRVFEALSDPICIGDDFVFIDGCELGSSRNARVRIPMMVIRMAQER